jgi:hypothetical protein
MAAKKMVRHVKSIHGSCWRMVQVRIGSKWEPVLDVEDDADSVVRPLQRAFDEVMKVTEVVECALPGCSWEVGGKRLRAWRHAKKKYPRRAGPFCSRECYHDHRTSR